MKIRFHSLACLNWLLMKSTKFRYCSNFGIQNISVTLCNYNTSYLIVMQIVTVSKEWFHVKLASNTLRCTYVIHIWINVHLNAICKRQMKINCPCRIKYIHVLLRVRDFLVCFWYFSDIFCAHIIVCVTQRSLRNMCIHTVYTQ